MLKYQTEQFMMNMENAFDALFQRRDVEIKYHYNSGQFFIYLDKLQIEQTLEDLLYNYNRFKNDGIEFKSYEEMKDYMLDYDI